MIFSKIRNYLRTRNDDIDLEVSDGCEIQSNIIWATDCVDIISQCCAICYNTDISNKSYDDKATYIGKRIASGHESICRHSNIVIHIFFPDKNQISDKYSNDIDEVIDACRYVKHKIITHANTKSILLSGSIAGYKWVIRHISNNNNSVLKCIMDELYKFNSIFFQDFIDDGIMNESLFEDLKLFSQFKPVEIKESTDKIDIINMDNIKYVYDKMSKYGYSEYDLMDFLTVTIKFKNMPRIISQQVMRHDAEPTQASQRYINYSKGSFIQPLNVDLEKEVTFNLFGQDITTKIKNIGPELIKIYESLVNAGLRKEQARSFLPNHMATDFYMTFTFRNIIHFLAMRLDKAAQIDVQVFAKDIDSLITSYLNINNSIYDYLEPIYKFDNKKYYEEIDEIIEE